MYEKIGHIASLIDYSYPILQHLHDYYIINEYKLSVKYDHFDLCENNYSCMSILDTA